MPMYEYQCRQCDKRFDKLVPATQKTEEMRCPQCDAPSLRRLISVFAVGGTDANKASNGGGCGCGGSCACGRN